MQKSDDWDDHPPTGVPIELLHDPRVPWDAKGAYGWIASQSEHTVELSGLTLAAAGPRGRNHAYGMLRDLEQYGWLTRTRYWSAEANGNITIWTLHPTPVPADQRTWTESKAKPRPAGRPEVPGATRPAR